MIKDNLAPNDVWNRWLESHVELIQEKGGGMIQGRCPDPDHQDTKPSFSANRNEYWFKCHGCGISGNAIQFAKRFNLDYGIFNGFDFQTGAYTRSFATSTSSNRANFAGNSKKSLDQKKPNIAPQKKVPQNGDFDRKQEAVSKWKLMPLSK